MIKRKDSIQSSITLNQRGGPGQVEKFEIASKEELLNHGRLYARMKFEKDCGIGYHEHQGETEIFYILKGEFEYIEDDKTSILHEGDIAILENGHSHSITNYQEETAELIALIITE